MSQIGLNVLKEQ